MAVTVSQHYLAEGGNVTNTLAQAGVVVGSGEGLLVLVMASDGTGTAPTISGVSAATAGALTSFINTSSPADGAGQVHAFGVFYLPSPTAGTQTVTATFGSTPLLCAMGVIVVAGHDTGTMIRAGSHAFGVGTGFETITVDSTTVATDLVFDFGRMRHAAGQIHNTVGAGQTELDDVFSSVSGTWTFLSSSETASGTTTTMSWTLQPDSAWSMEAVAVRQASASAANQLAWIRA